MTDQAASTTPTGMALTPLNPEYQKDPFTLLDQVREAGRMIPTRCSGRYIVSRFEDVQAILNDRDLAVDPRKAAEGTFNQMFRNETAGEVDASRACCSSTRRTTRACGRSFRRRSRRGPSNACGPH